MIKKKLIKTAAVLAALMTAFAFSGCGKKNTADVNNTAVTQATVSKETSSLAAKELTKTDATVADASETNGENNSDIVASEDVKKDDETKETIKNENNNSGNTEANNTHVHVWGENTETVHHDEQGHWENVQVGTQTVVDREAYDEVIYNDTPIHVCYCGKIFNDFDSIDYHSTHIVDLDGDPGCFDRYNHPNNYDINFKSYYEPGTYVMATQHHEAVTHEEPVYESRYVVDSTAYDETVTITYCTGCGAVK